MKRRTLLEYGLTASLLSAMPSAGLTNSARASTLHIALLHLAPKAGDIESNWARLEKALAIAVEQGAQWVITPELYISGYSFSDIVGTDWIQSQPDDRLRSFQKLVASFGVTVFLGLPERDAQSNALHNTLLVIGGDGSILGRHRKIRTLSVGSEAWSTPGELATVLTIPPFDKVGLMICSDAYAPWIAQELKAKGAQIMISAANWAPGLYGPSGEWERSTTDTGLPLIVCNRTGVGRSLDFTESESAVVKNGNKLFSMTSAEPAVFMLDWQMDAAQPAAAPTTVLLTDA